MASETRRLRGSKAHADGAWAETLAVWWLRMKGYRILARRYRVAAGEIDLVARRGNTLVAVEVKRRFGLREAMESLRAEQQQRILRVLEGFAAQHGFQDQVLRCDMIAVIPGKWPIHLADAWQERV
ncbi:MAG: YraN family protein [Alphaproteobacteria bacterium]|nr:YraN family protein [Alphaproteobacteria bacterium]